MFAVLLPTFKVVGIARYGWLIALTPMILLIVGVLTLLIPYFTLQTLLFILEFL